MKYGVLEILGLFLAVAGAGAIVGAAALVSVPLAVLVTGAFLLLAGVLGVFVAASLEKAEKAAAAPPARGEPR